MNWMLIFFAALISHWVAYKIGNLHGFKEAADFVKEEIGAWKFGKEEQR